MNIACQTITFGFDDLWLIAEQYRSALSAAEAVRQNYEFLTSLV